MKGAGTNYNFSTGRKMKIKQFNFNAGYLQYRIENIWTTENKMNCDSICWETSAN